MTAFKPVADVWVLVVLPRRSMVIEMISELTPVARSAGVSVEVGNARNALANRKGKSIRVVAASQLLAAISNRDPNRPLLGLDLVVCDNLELLDSAYELGVSLLRYFTQSFPTRYVGFSDSLDDPTDLAAWLGVDPYALHSFRPNDRDQSLMFHTQTFTIPQSAPLFRAMAKPAHAAIQVVSPKESAIVFVPSIGQCRPVAFDLITQSALGTDTDNGYLPPNIHEEDLENHLAHLQDQSLGHLVSRGVGIFHESIKKSDRDLMLGLYAEGIVRVLVVARESCWTLPVRAAVVVVMGTQYLHMDSEGSERHLRDYELSELVHMQGRAVQPSGSGHFNLFCQAEARDTITRFLNEGLPLESSLLETHDLELWYRDQKAKGGFLDRRQGVNALSFTFLAQRIASNPLYYDASASSLDENLSRIVDRLDNLSD